MVSVVLYVHTYVCIIFLSLQPLVMSDDVIEGDEGDSPVISERVQVINARTIYAM